MEMPQHVAPGSVDLIFTDPPYGINGADLDQHYNRDSAQVIPGYQDVPRDQYPQFSLQWIQAAAQCLRPGGSIYIVSGWSNLHSVLSALHGTDLQEINHLIAQYSFGVYTSRKWVSSHYHVLYWAKPDCGQQRRTFNTHCRHESTRLSYQDRLSVQPLPRCYRRGQRRYQNELNPSFIDRFIQYSSRPGDLVMDPFAGSGSTGRSALALGRRFIGFEINALAQERW